MINQKKERRRWWMGSQRLLHRNQLFSFFPFFMDVRFHSSHYSLEKTTAIELYQIAKSKHKHKPGLSSSLLQHWPDLFFQNLVLGKWGSIACSWELAWIFSVETHLRTLYRLLDLILLEGHPWPQESQQMYWALSWQSYILYQDWLCTSSADKGPE